REQLAGFAQTGRVVREECVVDQVRGRLGAVDAPRRDRLAAQETVVCRAVGRQAVALALLPARCRALALLGRALLPALGPRRRCLAMARRLEPATLASVVVFL